MPGRPQLAIFSLGALFRPDARTIKGKHRLKSPITDKSERVGASSVFSKPSNPQKSASLSTEREDAHRERRPGATKPPPLFDEGASPSPRLVAI